MDKVTQLAPKAEKIMTAKEARALLLSGCAPIIRELIRSATGNLFDPAHPEKGYINADPKAKQIVFDAIVPMMQQAGDLQKLNAASIADILQLLREGIVTVAEAKELMSIASMKFEIEELSSLAAKLDETQKAA